MPENLLEPDNAPAAPAIDRKKDDKTLDVPEKFRDPETGEVRVDALLKSYLELEKRLSKSLPVPEGDDDAEARVKLQRALGWPDSADGYQVEQRHPLAGPDPEINQALHQAGFTPRQVQLVYDLAAERLLPLIADAAAEFEADRERGRLAEHFGGAERFAEVARQVGAWGRASLPPAVFEALAATYDGVLAMQQMMQKGEPALASRAAPQSAPDQTELRKMMQDPRYWQKREPDFVARVTDGFKRLFPGS